jgi:hypothetical protein
MTEYGAILDDRLIVDEGDHQHRLVRIAGAPISRRPQS